MKKAMLASGIGMGLGAGLTAYLLTNKKTKTEKNKFLIKVTKVIFFLKKIKKHELKAL